jgi:hypothetical protein
MECPICLETIKIMNEIKTPCNHYFCEMCLNKWKYSNQHNYNLCPVCRQEITVLVANISLSNELVHEQVIYYEDRYEQPSNNLNVYYSNILFLKLLCAFFFIFFTFTFIIVILIAN